MSQALVREIKEYALSIGFSKVGIAPANGFTEYEAIVSERGACYSFLAGSAIKTPIYSSMRLIQNPS